MNKEMYKENANESDTLEICQRGYSNTHAQNTCKDADTNDIIRRKHELGLPLSDLRTIIDWFSCTFKKETHTVSEIFNLLYKYIEIPDDYTNGFDETVNYFHEENEALINKSSYNHNFISETGYKQSVSYANIVIFYDDYGNNNKGYKLSISGQGCRNFEMMLKNGYTWLDFFEEVMTYDVNITRLDLAVDDFNYYLPLPVVEKLAHAGRIVSKLKTFTPNGKYLLVNGESLGKTLEFGTKKSRIMFRLYEKGKQLGESFYWNRLEAEIKNENAVNAINYILANRDDPYVISKTTLGIIKRYIKLCDFEQTDSNRSRWKIWENWEMFLKDVEQVKIGKELPKSTIEKKMNWLQRQPPKSLAQVMMVLNGSTELSIQDIDNHTDFLKRLVLMGYEKLENKDIKLVESALNTNKKAYSHDISRLLEDDAITLDEFNNIKNIINL